MQKGQEYEAHPLFLPEDDEDPVPVDEIQISRVEQGQQVFYPRMFPANELTSLEQITAELGGGSYILIARHDKRISTRRKVVLPGKPKPMYDESRLEKEEKKPDNSSTPSIDPMMAMMGGQNGFMPLIMLMFQQQTQAADRQMQMFLAMMQSTRDSSAEDKAAARAEMNAQIERERIANERMMALMKEAMSQKSSGGSGEEFTRGVEFMRTFATQQVEMLKMQIKGDKSGEEPDWMGLLNTAVEAFQGFKMFQQMGTPGATGLPEGAPIPTPEAG